MRVATLVRLLQDQRVGGTNHWVVVLPPWPKLYHWRSPGTTAYHNWTKFFDLPSLNQFVPTIEFDEFLRTNGRTIDEVGKGLKFGFVAMVMLGDVPLPR